MIHTLRRRSALAALMLFVSALIGPLATARPVAAAGVPLVIDGHGNGHGIGMSQWGAYGYAADYGWTADQILDRYYGGTVAGTTDITSIAVRLMLLDDQQTAVVHDKGQVVVDGVPGGPWRSVVARETGALSYTVWARSDASVCPASGDSLASGWTQVASGLSSVRLRTQTDTSASADFGDLLAVCEPGGKVRSYRGVIRAVNGTAGENRTVNEAPLEQYLRPVVASEMSASWAPRGAQALRAQAIAARSYALAENRYSYAKTCDQICQFYPGAAWRTGVSGAYNRVEQSAVDTNVQSTAGMVRRIGSTSGAIALTMFSSSSGGWTAPSTLPFPAVEDLGDATAGNPHNRWTVTVDSGVLERAWPAIGTYTGVSKVVRNGFGDWGGRVVSITVVGTSGSVTLSGDSFRRAIGLRSDWFTLRGAGTETCGNRNAPAVTGAYSPAAAARFTPVVPQRLIDTRVGTGTDAGRVLDGCTLVVRANLPVGTTAVSINVVTTDTVEVGYLTIYPCGTARPTTSVVQTRPGRVVSGSAVVPVAADGTFCVFTSTATNVVIDLNGSYSAGGAARFEPIDPVRRLDSRGGPFLAAGSIVRVGTRGSSGAPSTNTAASITIHALDAKATGYVTAWPCDAAQPVASSANVNAGESSTTAADVAVSAGGEVCLFVSASMHLIVDLDGWFGPTGTADFRAVSPFRLVDTRNSIGWNGRFSAAATRRIQAGSAGGLPGAPAVRALATQFTGATPAAAGYVTVHPCLASTPNASSLVFRGGTNTAANVKTRVSASGEWCVLASAATDLIVDVSGWYG
ncbi:MAG: SpoIID/LytB domain-containing protein [Ilumatobacteraceae bacterium]